MGQSDSRQQPQQPHSSSSNRNNDHNNYHHHQPTTDTDSASTNFTTATATSAIHSEHPLNNNDHMTDATFNNNNNNPTPSLAMPSLHAPHLNGGPSQLLSNEQLISLRRELPSTQRMHDDWILLYSSRKMGTSIKQFTERCLNRGPTLILIRDTFGRVFGSFASQDWKRNGQFFGDSNCFLFTFDPSFATSVAPQNNNGVGAGADDDDTTFTADTAHQEPGIQVFRSSNRNENYMYFNEGNEFNEYNGLALGGRMNFFCLSLDRTFSRGTSRPGLLTYNFSPCLCTDVYDVDDAPDDLDQYHFIVDQIEVWGFPLSESQMLDLQFKLNQKQARVAAVKGDDADYFIMENAGMVGSGANFRVEQKTDEQKMKDAGL